MIAIIDTNFLAKYFTGNKKDIGKKAREIFENNNTFLIIPSIVLVELKYLVSIKEGCQKERLILQTNSWEKKIVWCIRLIRH